MNNLASDTDFIIWDLFWGLQSALDRGSALGSSGTLDGLKAFSVHLPRVLSSQGLGV